MVKKLTVLSVLVAAVFEWNNRQTAGAESRLERSGIRHLHHGEIVIGVGLDRKPDHDPRIVLYVNADALLVVSPAAVEVVDRVSRAVERVVELAVG
jgi:hypothetical protein